MGDAGSRGRSGPQRDGDLTDDIVFLYDDVLGTTIDTGLALGANEAVLGETHALFHVWEGFQGSQDLNGDGDVNDNVLHWYDGRSGTIVNVGIAAFDDLHLQGDRCLVGITETQDGRDWTGDGDTDDVAWVLLDALSQRLIPLGFGTEVASFGQPMTAVEEDVWLVEIYEGHDPGALLDLNGDGDSLDTNCVIFDLGPGRIWIPRFSPWTLPALVEDQIYIRTFEDEYGSDWNQDGDDDDWMGVFVDRVSGAEVPTNAARYISSGGANRTLHFGFEFVLGDVTGDGDEDDTVLIAFDRSSGVETVLPYESGGVAIPADGTPRAFCFFREEDNVPLDRNGDGDTDDVVLGVWDYAVDTLTFSEAAVSRALNTKSGSILVSVDESSQGPGTVSDWNGDGDASDFVLGLLDADTGLITSLNLALAGPGPFLERACGLVVTVSEASEGRDWSGDGDLSDLAVLHLAKAAATPSFVATTRNTGSLPFSFSGLFTLVENELDVGIDLSEDGLVDDLVLRLVRMR